VLHVIVRPIVETASLIAASRSIVYQFVLDSERT